MKLNELLIKLNAESAVANPNDYANAFAFAIKSPQGLEFLEAVYKRGRLYGFEHIDEWQSIKSEIEGEG